MNTHFLDLFFRTALMTTNEFVVIFIILSGYIFLKRDAFGRAFLIFAFAIVLNPFLKSLFQIPLPPTAGVEGWAFPSGHMLTSSIFWLWLAWEYKNKSLYIFTAILLSSIGFGLVYCGYHYPVDIPGALFFAILTLYLYHLLLKLPILKNTPPSAGFILAIIAIILLFFIPNVTQRSYVWVGFGSLLGFSLGWLMSYKYSNRNPSFPLKIKLFIFILSFVGLFAIEGIFLLVDPKSYLTKTLHYFILALWLSAISQAITIKLFTHNRFIRSLFNQQPLNKSCN